MKISFLTGHHFNNNSRENHLDKRNALFFPEFLMDRSLIKRIVKRIYIEVSGGGITHYLYFVEKTSLQLCHFIMDLNGVP